MDFKHGRSNLKRHLATDREPTAIAVRDREAPGSNPGPPTKIWRGKRPLRAPQLTAPRTHLYTACSQSASAVVWSGPGGGKIVIAPCRSFRRTWRIQTPSRRSQPTDPPRRPRLRKSREEAARLLEEQIELGEDLFGRINPGAYLPGAFSELETEYYGWTSYAKELLRTLFDTDEVANEFDHFFRVA